MSFKKEYKRQRSEDERRIYVGNIHYDVGERELRDVFETIAPIEKVKFVVDYQTKQSRGIAFLTFQNATDANKVLTHCEKVEIALRDRKLRIQRANPRPEPMEGFRRDLRQVG